MGRLTRLACMALFFGLLPCRGEVDFDDINLRTADA